VLKHGLGCVSNDRRFLGQRFAQETQSVPHLYFLRDKSIQAVALSCYPSDVPFNRPEHGCEVNLEIIRGPLCHEPSITHLSDMSISKVLLMPQEFWNKEKAEATAQLSEIKIRATRLKAAIKLSRQTKGMESMPRQRT
jgi:hypothetical protein